MRWLICSEMTPEWRASCEQWIGYRLRDLARSGNSPVRPAGWPAEVLDRCHAKISDSGEILTIELLTSKPGNRQSLFALPPAQ